MIRKGSKMYPGDVGVAVSSSRHRRVQSRSDCWEDLDKLISDKEFARSEKPLSKFAKLQKKNSVLLKREPKKRKFGIFNRYNLQEESGEFYFPFHFSTLTFFFID